MVFSGPVCTYYKTNALLILCNYHSGPPPYTEADCTDDCQLTYCQACYYYMRPLLPPPECSRYETVTKGCLCCLREWAKCVWEENGDTGVCKMLIWSLLSLFHLVVHWRLPDRGKFQMLSVSSMPCYSINFIYIGMLLDIVFDNLFRCSHVYIFPRAVVLLEL